MRNATPDSQSSRGAQSFGRSASANTSGSTSQSASKTESSTASASTSSNRTPTTGCESITDKIIRDTATTDAMGNTTRLGLLFMAFEATWSLWLGIFVFSLANLSDSHFLSCLIIGATLIGIAAIKAAAPAIAILRTLFLASSKKAGMSIASDSTSTDGGPQ